MVLLRTCAVALFLFSGLIFSTQFTEKRGKRGPSIGSLKESCCELFGNFLDLNGQLLRRQGSLQSVAVEAVGGYAKGDKESWCEQASKQKLMQCKEKLAQLNEKIEALLAECDAVQRELSAA